MLQETKCDVENMTRITMKIWGGCEEKWIEAKGASRGLSTLWDPYYMDLKEHASKKRILKLKFKVKGTGEIGYISNAYGPQSPSLKFLVVSLQYQTWVLGAIST